jgi:hypothetical protein
MEIIIVGADPPCPRCREAYERIKRVVRELNLEISLKKIAYTSKEAQRLGKVGTGHDVAEWAGIKMDWDRIHELAVGEWTHELDALLMPLKEKAEQENWIMTPVIVLDGELVHCGYVPGLDDIRRMLKTRQPISAIAIE